MLGKPTQKSWKDGAAGQTLLEGQPRSCHLYIAYSSDFYNIQVFFTTTIKQKGVWKNFRLFK